MEKEIVSKLVYSIVQFLRNQLETSESASSLLNEEGSESVEVALQCLETAYGISSNSTHLAVSQSLYNIFNEATQNISCENLVSLGLSPPSQDDKDEAEKLKNEGNMLMREEKFDEALDRYTKAIAKDSTNAVYYCNRAASHSKLNNHEQAINDCKRALNIQSDYSKAYGRMGLAYSAMDNAQEAKVCYERALEIEPDNESYKGNLAIAEEKLKSQSSEIASSSSNPGNFNPFSALGGSGLNLGGLGNLAASMGGSSGGAPDVQGLFNNPALMNMASQLMQDPGVQNMMSSFLGGAPGANGPPPPAPAPAAPSSSAPPNDPSPPSGAGGTGSMEALLSVGRQLAEQMQSQHPDLIDQLRNQMNRNPGGDGPNQDPPAGAN